MPSPIPAKIMSPTTKIAHSTKIPQPEYQKETVAKEKKLQI